MSLTSYRAAPPRERVARERFRAGWYLAIKIAVVKDQSARNCHSLGRSWLTIQWFTKTTLRRTSPHALSRPCCATLLRVGANPPKRTHTLSHAARTAHPS